MLAAGPCITSMRVLIALLLSLSSSAHAQSDDGSEKVELKKPNSGKRYELTEVTTSVFDLEGGWLVDVGACSAERQGTWSTYSCLSLNLGRQNGTLVGGDALEWGLQLRPISNLSFTAGGAMGILSGVVDAFGCAVQVEFRSGKKRETCKKVLLPVQLYPALGAHLAIPTSRGATLVNVVARYQVAVPSTILEFQAPAGAALAFGTGFRF